MHVGGNSVVASDRDEIVAALRKEESRVSAGVQQAREKAKGLEAELKGIRSALAALTGPSNGAAKKKAKPTSTNDAAKPPKVQRQKQAQKAPSQPNRSPNKGESG